MDTGKELLSLDELPTGATDAEFTPDGKRILTVGDGTLRRKFNTSPEDPKQPAPKKVDLGGFSFEVSAGGSTRRGIQHLWDATTGKLVATLFKGDESGFQTATRLFSRENIFPELRPDLAVDYSASTWKTACSCTRIRRSCFSRLG